MRFTILTTASLASLAAAAPAQQLEERQGGCNVGFVFARGSTEPSPIGFLVGPGLQSALKRLIPSMITFPVGYAASIATNVSMDRTDAASVAEGAKAFNKAAGCKVIIAGGYSQGAAVMHNVIGLKKTALSDEIKSKIAGVALFGDTRNKQDGGHIPNFPNEKARVWCNASDGVCGGGLNVNAGHLSYSASQTGEAAKWLDERIKAMGVELESISAVVDTSVQVALDAIIASA
ncbi:cutinase-domain-containing protein [Tothia fuscella]|uniref:cutinase n=1 Tax=Tothia fuscella TaxID=1048955 RepID=A0A9P4NS17_9PEZI|nr:cutinase-domain-containing protein [Tothia fuscella]